ncbi:FAS1-like dehydratase domain-containing protein [Nocardia macrotermitis]|nr:MaoC family dehydratase N-terminal domain-containing protein [Nocardia macrotermitis]
MNSVGRPHISEGRRYCPTERQEVRAEDIRRYARMIGDDHPAYATPEAAAAFGFGGLVAPPTFASLLWLRAERRILPTLLDDSGSVRLLHTEQTLRIGRLLVAGDVIATDVYIESAEQFNDYEKFCVTTVLTDKFGIVVQVGTSTLLSCGTRIRDRIATSPALDTARARLTTHPPHDPLERPHTDRLRVGDELPRNVIRPRHGDITGFRRMMNDGLPHLTSTAGAAPGLLRFGWLARYLGSRFDHPAAITTYRAEFSHYCVRGPARTSDIEFSGRITDIDDSTGTAEIAVDAVSAGRRLFVRAGASLAVRARQHIPA